MALIRGNNSKYLEHRRLGHQHDRKLYDKALGVFVILGVTVTVLGIVFAVLDHGMNLNNRAVFF